MSWIGNISPRFKLIFAILLVWFLGFSQQRASAQALKWWVDKRFKGTHSGKKIGIKSKGKYKYLKKKGRVKGTKKRKLPKRKGMKKSTRKRNKSIKKRNYREYKRRSKRTRKLVRGGKSLYSGGFGKKKKRGKKKKGQFKGRYPRSKADITHKLTVTAMVGVVVTPPNEKPNGAGQPENMFANYQPGPAFGGGVNYNYNSHFSIGGDARFIPIGKENYKIRAMQIGFNLMYKFGGKRAKIKPYIFGGMNYSFATIKQDPFTETVNPETSYSVQDPTHIFVKEITYREPGLTLSFIPMLGYRAGLGATYEVTRKIDAFAQLEYNVSFARNKATLNQYFPNNKSDFTFYTLTMGVKFNLFKNKSLY